MFSHHSVNYFLWCIEQCFFVLIFWFFSVSEVTLSIAINFNEVLCLRHLVISIIYNLLGCVHRIHSCNDRWLDWSLQRSVFILKICIACYSYYKISIASILCKCYLKHSAEKFPCNIFVLFKSNLHMSVLNWFQFTVLIEVDYNKFLELFSTLPGRKSVLMNHLYLLVGKFVSQKMV